MLNMLDSLPNMHPVFVHFSVALFSISTVLFCVSYFISSQNWKYTLLMSARINLWIGTGITFLTVGAGFIEYYTVVHDASSHYVMTIQRNWAIGTGISFLLLTVWSIQSYLKKIGPSLLFLLFMLCASGGLIMTAHEGGEAVYNYGIGVESLPSLNDDD